MENKENSNWKCGFFYYNPDDKRIFPPKRYGFGWTINFANPLSILIFIIILVIIITLSICIKDL